MVIGESYGTEVSPKKYLFTHTDLDGVSCAALAIRYMKGVIVEYCDYKDINDIILKFMKETDISLVDKVYITDISVNEEVAELINSTEWSNVIELYDHHATAKWLNVYNWATVIETESPNSCIQLIESGTSLFYNYVIHPLMRKDKLIYENINHDHITSFVDAVRRYDTWEWKKTPEDDYPTNLAILFGWYGIDRFLGKVIHHFETGELIININDMTLLKILEEKNLEYFKYKHSHVKVYNTNGYSVGYILTDRPELISRTCDYILEKETGLDFLVCIGDNTLNFRTKRNNIDLSFIAKKFNGGGHPKAAGCPSVLNIMSAVCEKLELGMSTKLEVGSMYMVVNKILNIIDTGAFVKVQEIDEENNSVEIVHDGVVKKAPIDVFTTSVRKM